MSEAERITSSEELPELVNPKEFAQLCGCHHQTIYAAIDRGEIPGVRRIGRRIVIHKETAMKWLREGTG